MFRSHFEKFIIQRVLLLFVVLAACGILFLKDRWNAVAGLTVGTALGVLKFRFTVNMYSRLLLGSGSSITVPKSVLKYTFSLVLTMVVLFICVLASEYLFFGTAAGVLLVPAVVFFHGIAVGLGLSKSRFD